MRVFYKLRVIYKLIKRKLFCIDSFCKECGRDVRDFIVDDGTWELIDPFVDYGHTLCYECFVDKCEKIEINTLWRLEKER